VDVVAGVLAVAVAGAVAGPRGVMGEALAAPVAAAPRVTTTRVATAAAVTLRALRARDGRDIVVRPSMDVSVNIRVLLHGKRLLSAFATPISQPASRNRAERGAAQLRPDSSPRRVTNRARRSTCG
jgi:hypothetical protein